MISLLIIFIFSAGNSYSRELYTLQDLKILAQEKEFSEFFEHAKDISPSNRDSEWSQLVSQMGIEYLQNLKIKKYDLPSDIKSISKWFVLSKHEFFKDELNKFILRLSQNCLDSLAYKDCKESIKNNFSFATNPITGVEIYEKIIEKNPSWPKVELYTYLEKILKSEIAEFYCDDPPVQAFFKQNISLNHISPEKLQLHKDCQKHSFVPARQLLVHNNITIRDRAKEYLRFYNAYTQKDQVLYSFMNFLDNKKDAEAISSLTSLSKNPQLRAEILELFKKDTPYLNINKICFKRSLVKTKLINRSFPEFIQSEVKKCFKENIVENCKTLTKIDEVLKIIPTIYKANSI